jgi:hypothetical protein
MAGFAFVDDGKFIKQEEKKRRQDAEKALQKAQEEKKAGEVREKTRYYCEINMILCCLLYYDDHVMVGKL